ncbi:hypothetical protein ACLK1S_08990 [Escherichia coli]
MCKSLAFHWARRGTDFSGFLDRIGTKTDDFTFNQHVQAIAICQWLGNGNIEMIFATFNTSPTGRR